MVKGALHDDFDKVFRNNAEGILNLMPATEAVGDDDGAGGVVADHATGGGAAGSGRIRRDNGWHPWHKDSGGD